MDTCVHYVKQINDVFENVYVDRSIVLCGSLNTMYNVAELLECQDYPVAIATIFNTKDPIVSFIKGKVRMLIIRESLVHILIQYMPEVLKVSNVVFCLDGVTFDNPEMDSDKKIFSLEEV